VNADARYLGLLAIRTRAPMIAVAMSFFAVVGVFADRLNEVGASWGLTACLSCGLAAWIVGAVLDAEPPAQYEIATTAVGGTAKRSIMDSWLIGMTSVLLTVMFVGYPLVLYGLGRADLFLRAPLTGDVVGAVIAHLSCAALGGTVGALLARPRTRSRAIATTATLAALLVLVATSKALGPIGGPLAVARALTDAHPGTITGPEVIASGSCVVLALLFSAIAPAWASRAG
jgi:hypothetical protein